MIEVRIDPLQFVADRESRLAVRLGNVGAGSCTNIVFKVGLPSDFLVLEGNNRIEVPRLRPGENYSQQLIVRPKTAGKYAVDSVNFSYRDQYGTSVRVSDWRAELSVMSAVPLREKALDVECAGGELSQGEWDILRIRARNASGSAVHGVTMTVSGPVRFGPAGSQARLATLAAGEAAEIPFVVFSDDSGRHVPIEVHTTSVDTLGRTRRQGDLLLAAVRRRALEVRQVSEGRHMSGRHVILFLAASPTDMAPLRSGEEMREIQARLRLGRHRDRFRFEQVSAARLEDIGQALMDHDPHIVHFSGHGEKDGSLYVEDEQGFRISAMPEGLVGLFRLHAKTIRCVIVNACHTETLAKALAEHIDYVVAMRDEIADGAAITFSVGFYQGLAGGAPVPEAFERGLALLQAKRGSPHHDVPALFAKASDVGGAVS